MKFSLLVILSSVLALGDAGAQESGQHPLTGRLVDCGTEKVAVIGHTKSKDEHFALAWTLRPNRKKDPVDWSSYDPDNWGLFFDKYSIISDEGEMQKQDYLVVDGVVDLTAKTFEPLVCVEPHFPGKNHHFMSVTWSDNRRGARYAIVSNEERWDTLNLWLVVVNAGGPQVKDLSETADKAVTTYMQKRDPKDYRNYQTTYEPGNNSTFLDGTTSPPEFQKDSVTIHFSTGIPRSDVNQDAGNITFALPKGTVLRVFPDKKR